MSDIIFSRAIQQKAKEYGVAEAAYLCYAAMRACGIGINDAWNLTFQNKGITWSKEQLKHEQQKLESLAGVTRFIEEHKLDGKVIQSKDSAELLARATNKESKLIELQTVLETLTPGSNEWLKVNQQIIDVSRMKQDEISTEDNTILHYIPVNYPNRCEECLIWQNGQCPLQKKCKDGK